ISPPAGLEQHPLNLIRVYLTFPLKETALTTDSGLILSVGCCLYLATGTILGIPFHSAQTLLIKNGSFLARMGLNTVLAIAIWLINFMGFSPGCSRCFTAEIGLWN